MGNEQRSGKEEATAPFCAREPEPGLLCPVCGEDEVCVREHETYYEGQTVEAFCDHCGVLLEVVATVEIEFSDVAVKDV